MARIRPSTSARLPARRPVLVAGSIFSLAVFVTVTWLVATNPTAGMRILWQGIVPLLPLLLLAAPNLWTSVCPMAVLQSVPRRLHLPSRQIRLHPGQQLMLESGGIALLYVLVPLRHLVFDPVPATDLVVLLLLPIVAAAAGFWFLGLSGWCNGLCPVQPVESLYGIFTRERARPETCRDCAACNASCRRLHPEDGLARLTQAHPLRLFAYSFPGFVLGWFLARGQTSLATVFAVNWGVAAGTALLGIGLERFGLARTTLVKLSALAALTTYYAFRVPELIQVWSS